MNTMKKNRLSAAIASALLVSTVGVFASDPNHGADATTIPQLDAEIKELEDKRKAQQAQTDLNISLINAHAYDIGDNRDNIEVLEQKRKVDQVETNKNTAAVKKNVDAIQNHTEVIAEIRDNAHVVKTASENNQYNNTINYANSLKNTRKITQLQWDSTEALDAITELEKTQKAIAAGIVNHSEVIVEIRDNHENLKKTAINNANNIVINNINLSENNVKIDELEKDQKLYHPLINAQAYDIGDNRTNIEELERKRKVHQGETNSTVGAINQHAEVIAQNRDNLSALELIVTKRADDNIEYGGRLDALEDESENRDEYVSDIVNVVLDQQHQLEGNSERRDDELNAKVDSIKVETDKLISERRYQMHSSIENVRDELGAENAKLQKEITAATTIANSARIESAQHTENLNSQKQSIGTNKHNISEHSSDIHFLERKELAQDNRLTMTEEKTAINYKNMERLWDSIGKGGSSCNSVGGPIFTPGSPIPGSPNGPALSTSCYTNAEKIEVNSQRIDDAAIKTQDLAERDLNAITKNADELSLVNLKLNSNIEYLQNIEILSNKAQVDATKAIVEGNARDNAQDDYLRIELDKFEEKTEITDGTAFANREYMKENREKIEELGAELIKETDNAAIAENAEAITSLVKKDIAHEELLDKIDTIIQNTAEAEGEGRFTSLAIEQNRSNIIQNKELIIAEKGRLNGVNAEQDKNLVGELERISIEQDDVNGLQNHRMNIMDENTVVNIDRINELEETVNSNASEIEALKMGTVVNVDAPSGISDEQAEFNTEVTEAFNYVNSHNLRQDREITGNTDQINGVERNSSAINSGQNARMDEMDRVSAEKFNEINTLINDAGNGDGGGGTSGPSMVDIVQAIDESNSKQDTALATEMERIEREQHNDNLRITAADDKNHQQDTRMNGMDAAYADEHARLDSVNADQDTRMDVMDQKRAGNANAINAHTDRIAQLAQWFRDKKDEIMDNTRGREAQGKTIVANKNSQDEINGKVNLSLENQNTRMDGIDGQNTRQNNMLDGMNADLTKQNKVVENNAAEIEALKKANVPGGDVDNAAVAENTAAIKRHDNILGGMNADLTKQNKAVENNTADIQALKKANVPGGGVDNAAVAENTAAINRIDEKNLHQDNMLGGMNADLTKQNKAVENNTADIQALKKANVPGGGVDNAAVAENTAAINRNAIKLKAGDNVNARQNNRLTSTESQVSYNVGLLTEARGKISNNDSKIGANKARLDSMDTLINDIAGGTGTGDANLEVEIALLKGVDNAHQSAINANVTEISKLADWFKRKKDEVMENVRGLAANTEADKKRDTRMDGIDANIVENKNEFDSLSLITGANTRNIETATDMANTVSEKVDGFSDAIADNKNTDAIQNTRMDEMDRVSAEKFNEINTLINDVGNGGGDTSLATEKNSADIKKNATRLDSIDATISEADTKVSLIDNELLNNWGVTNTNKSDIENNNKINTDHANQLKDIDSALVSNKIERDELNDNLADISNNAKDLKAHMVSDTARLDQDNKNQDSRLNAIDVINVEQDIATQKLSEKIEGIVSGGGGANEEQVKRIAENERVNIDQDNRLREIDAVNGGQNNRFDAIDSRNTEQDESLAAELERIAREQHNDNLRITAANDKNHQQDTRMDGIDNTNTGQDNRMKKMEDMSAEEIAEINQGMSGMTEINIEQDARMDNMDLRNDEQDSWAADEFMKRDEKNTVQDDRLVNIESTNSGQDSRLEAMDAINIDQGTKIKANVNRLGYQQTQLDKHHKTINGVITANNEQNAYMSTTRNITARNKGEIETNKLAFETETARLDNENESQYSRLDAIDVKNVEQDNDRQELEIKIDSNKTDIENLSSHIESIDSNTTHVSGNAEDINLNTLAIDTNKENVASNINSIDTNKENIATNTNTLSSQQTQLNEHRTTLDGVVVKNDEQQSYMSATRKITSQNEKDIKTYSQGVNKAQEAVKVIQEHNIVQTEVILAQKEKIEFNRTGIYNNNARINDHAIAINAQSSRLDGVYSSISSVEKKALAGIAISMATDVIQPAPGKKFSLSISMAEYEGTSAIGISGSGRINKSTTLFFGYGTDSNNQHSATKIGTNFQW